MRAALTASQSLALRLYGLAWWFATPLVMAYLLWRAIRQPEYRRHWGERWALATSTHAPPSPSASTSACTPTPRQGPPIWLHAVSVGETRAAQPLIEALLARDPHTWILLTHMTPTGREVGEQLYATRWPQRVHQVYLPYDMPWAVRRFLARWRPRLGLLMETELWPVLCHEAALAGLPMVLVSARLSQRSLRRAHRWRVLIEPALASLSAAFAQTEPDAARLAQLGRPGVPVLGNLKFDVQAATEGVALGAQWREAFGGRPVVLCASTRDGEEALLLQAWRKFHVWDPACEAKAATNAAAPLMQATAAVSAPSMPTTASPLLIIVPRHPQRFDAVAAEIQTSGLSMRRRSDPQWPQGAADVEVVLGDSMGEMAAWYGCAQVAIIGGSLLPFGGQNLIEACALGVPVLVGPHTRNFEQAAEQAIAAGGAARVPDAYEAIDTALRWLADEASRLRAGEAGQAFAQSHRGATVRTMRALGDWLP